MSNTRASFQRDCYFIELLLKDVHLEVGLSRGINATNRRTDDSTERPSTSNFRPRITVTPSLDRAMLPPSLQDNDRLAMMRGDFGRSLDDQQPTTSSDAMDLKGEITRFLEDLIDKHPETLDAIENVRMSRMAARGKGTAMQGGGQFAVAINNPTSSTAVARDAR